MTNRRSILRRPEAVLVALAFALAAPAAFAGWDEGVAAFKARNYEQAIAEFQQVVEQQPDQQAGYVMLGRSLLAAGRASDAVAPLGKALELNADDVASRVYLAQAFDQSGKPRECIETINKLNVGSLPKNAQIPVYQMRSRSHLLLDNKRAAAADMGKVAELKGDAQSRFEYGKLLQSDAQLDAAVKAYDSAVRMDGSKAEWKQTLVNALKIKGRRTQGAAKAGIYAEAEEIARSLVASAPSFDNLLLLGEVQLGGKRYDAAASTFQQAISKRSDDWHAHFYLGQAYSSLERYGDAEAPLNKALQFASGNDQEQIWKQLGFVFAKRNKYAEAIDAYQKGNDPAGVERVRENERIAKENRETDEFNENIKELERQQEIIRRQMEEIPGAVSEPPR